MATTKTYIITRTYHDQLAVKRPIDRIHCADHRDHAIAIDDQLCRIHRRTQTIHHKRIVQRIKGRDQIRRRMRMQGIPQPLRN